MVRILILGLVSAMFAATPLGMRTTFAQSPTDANTADVAYDQVLADPDNIDLSYRFALTQIRHGDLLGALATLDRLILIVPDEPNIRALRAVVLYRLDNLPEAGSEMDNLLALDLNPDLRANLERYASELDKRDRTWRMNLLTSFGYQFDTNRPGLPSGNRVETFLGKADLEDVSQDDDHALTGLARLGIEHDFEGQDIRTVFGSVGFYGADQFQLDEFDTQDASAELGARLELGEALFTPRFGFDHLRLDGDSFLNVFAGDLRVDWRASDPVNIWGKFGLAHFDYENSSALPANDFQTGTDVGVTLGTDLFLGSDHRLTVSATHHAFSSDTPWEQFIGERANLNHTWLLGSGIFLLTDLSASYDNYRRPDPLIGQKEREDVILRARTTLGIPLNALIDAEHMPEVLDGLTFAVFGEYLRSESNIINFDYDNVRAGATISKRWQF
jgi:tetratricopeptide (TPR) repeat protein